ncbi:shikimate dehydrogenase, partial [Gemmatimonadota bacterium]
MSAENNELNRFAFALHPVDMTDVIRFEPGSAGRRPEVVEKVLEWLPAYELSHITGIRSPTGAEAEGWFIVVAYLPHQYLEFSRETIMDKIMGAEEIAREYGASVMGLGG